MANTPTRPSTAALLTVLAALTGAAGADTAQSQDYTFRFAPPDGTVVAVTLDEVREYEVAGASTNVRHSQAEMLVSMHRDGDGYRLEETLVSSRMTQNGEVVHHPVSEAMQGLTVSFRVDAHGRLLGIDGYAGLAEKVAALVSPALAAALAPMVSEQAMLARQVAEWNGRIGDYAGVDFSLGDAIEGEASVTLPSGRPMVYTTRIWFPDTEPCGETTCVRVEQRYDSDDPALSEHSGEVVSGIYDALDAPAPEIDGQRIAGRVSRLIDPRTMLIYREASKRVITMTMDIPGGGKGPARFTQERHYAYAYR